MVGEMRVAREKEIFQWYSYRRVDTVTMITCVHGELGMKDANKELKDVQFDAELTVATRGKGPLHHTRWTRLFNYITGGYF